MRRGFAEVVLLLTAAACSQQRTPEPGVLFDDCVLGAPASSERVQARCTTIDGLRVAVLGAEGGRRAADPMFFIPGGPGQSGGDAFATVARAFALVRRHRDIVVIDPRGTGGSEPLRCSTKLPDDMRRMDALERLKACAREVGERGREVSTARAVQDIDAVRRSLGYQVIDIYAASYGTRVALEVLRALPSTVRAAVLDGVLAPESSLGAEQSLTSEHAFAAIWERCVAEPACAPRYADLRATAARLHSQLAQRPALLRVRNPRSGENETVELDDRLLEDALRTALYQSELVALLPKILDDAAHGELDGLASLALLARDSLEEAVNPLVYLSVICAEDFPYLRPLERTTMFEPRLPELAEACKVWPAAPPNPLLKIPVTTSTPLLLVSGANDPVTPPAEAEKVASHAGRARSIVLADQGHIGVVRGCMPRVIADFFDDASPETLDATCVGRTSVLPLFTGPNAP